MAKKYDDMTKAELIAEIDAIKADVTVRLEEGAGVRDRLRDRLREYRVALRDWKKDCYKWKEKAERWKDRNEAFDRLKDSEEKNERLRSKLKKSRREARQWRSRALSMCGDRDTWKRQAKTSDEMIRHLRQRAEKWRDRYSYARAELRDAERALRKERVERVREEEENGKE